MNVRRSLTWNSANMWKYISNHTPVYHTHRLQLLNALSQNNHCFLDQKGDESAGCQQIVCSKMTYLYSVQAGLVNFSPPWYIYCSSKPSLVLMCSSTVWARPSERKAFSPIFVTFSESTQNSHFLCFYTRCESKATLCQSPPCPLERLCVPQHHRGALIRDYQRFYCKLRQRLWLLCPSGVSALTVGSSPLLVILKLCVQLIRVVWCWDDHAVFWVIKHVCLFEAPAATDFKDAHLMKHRTLRTQFLLVQSTQNTNNNNLSFVAAACWDSLLRHVLGLEIQHAEYRSGQKHLFTVHL